MATDQKTREALEVALCCDDFGLFRIASQRVEEKKDIVVVSYIKDESGGGKSKWMIKRKFGRSIWKS